jgi:hypothetical protein
MEAEDTLDQIDKLEPVVGLDEPFDSIEDALVAFANVVEIQAPPFRPTREINKAELLKLLEESRRGPNDRPTVPSMPAVKVA